MAAPRLTAKQVLECLATRHSRDVFFPEVNMGSAWANCPRMDAWAMPRSWRNWRVIGYEIKVSRSDFLADQKWDAYLRHCHEFSFVAPKGVVSKEELPDQVGLIEVASTGTRLYTRRKAVRRSNDEVDVVPAMSYLLMSRTVPGRPDDPSARDLDYWRTWLADRVAGQALGSQVSVQVAREISRMRRECADLRKRNKALESVGSEFKRLGINVHGWDPVADTQRVVRGVRQGFEDELLSLRRSLDKVIETIETHASAEDDNGERSG